MSGIEEDMCNPNFEADFLSTFYNRICKFFMNSHCSFVPVRPKPFGHLWGRWISAMDGRHFLSDFLFYFNFQEMEVCTDSTLLQALTMVAAIIFFLLLFLHLSITADSFFSKNIASIVDLHKISQNIAGVTFMVQILYLKRQSFCSGIRKRCARHFWLHRVRDLGKKAQSGSGHQWAAGWWNFCDYLCGGFHCVERVRNFMFF